MFGVAQDREAGLDFLLRGHEVFGAEQFAVFEFKTILGRHARPVEHAAPEGAEGDEHVGPTNGDAHRPGPEDVQQPAQPDEGEGQPREGRAEREKRPAQLLCHAGDGGGREVEFGEQRPGGYEQEAADRQEHGDAQKPNGSVGRQVLIDRVGRALGVLTGVGGHRSPL